MSFLYIKYNKSLLYLYTLFCLYFCTHMYECLLNVYSRKFPIIHSFSCGAVGSLTSLPKQFCYMKLGDNNEVKKIDLKMEDI